MRLRSKIIILLLLLFSFIPNVYAASGVFSYGNTTLNVGETKNIDIKLDNASDVQAIGGMIGVENEECVRINSYNGLNGVFFNDNLFAFAGLNEMTSGTKFASISITGLKECTTKLSFPTATITSTDSHDYDATISAGLITVTNPVQTTQTNNNNSNNSSVVTTAPKNEQKTTTTNNNSNQVVNNNINNNQVNDNAKIAVNQIDLTLSSLVVQGYIINFNKNQLEYSLEVENNVENIIVEAKASDNNSNVRIEGNNNLLIGENIVKVIVSNNNGEKVYIIKVNKKQDPQKVYNTDNYLTNIVPSVGILSPQFNKDRLDYVIYLPFEVDKITFDTTLSSPDTSHVEVEGKENLEVGENKYIIKVRAENGEIREYIVLVKRSNIFSFSSNNFLKSITLTNGNLTSEFDKNITTYYYTKSDGFKYDFELEDPNSKVSVYENNGTINIVVEAPSGDIRVYTLVEKKSNLIKCLLLVGLSIIMGYLLKCLFIELRKSKRKKIRREMK